jgi:type I restriction enzyme, S subunit
MANDNHDSHDASTGLPAGWVWTTIGDVAQLVRGVSYDKSAVTETAQSGYVPVLRATNIQDERLTLDAELVYVPDRFGKSEQLLQTGDVVICMSSGSKHLVGKAAQLAHEWHGSFGTFCAAARFDTAINQKYAGYFFSSPNYRSLIRQKSSGVNINNLRHHDIEDFPFPIAPRAEQHRIVAKIEEQFTRLDAGVAALKRAQANLKRYKAAVLKAACEGKLVAQDASDEPASELLKRILAERQTTKTRGRGDSRIAPTDELPELPQGRCWANLEAVSDALGGYAFSSADYTDSGFQIVKIGNVKMGRLELDTHPVSFTTSPMKFKKNPF